MPKQKKDFSKIKILAPLTSEMISESINYMIEFILVSFENDSTDHSEKPLNQADLLGLAQYLAFAHEHATLGQQTIVAWLASGGEESKAREAIRDYVSSVRREKMKTIEEEEKKRDSYF